MSNLEKNSKENHQNRDRENKAGRENWNISYNPSVTTM